MMGLEIGGGEEGRGKPRNALATRMRGLNQRCLNATSQFIYTEM